MRCQCIHCRTHFFYASASMKECPVCGASRDSIRDIVAILNDAYKRLEVVNA